MNEDPRARPGRLPVRRIAIGTVGLAIVSGLVAYEVVNGGEVHEVTLTSRDVCDYDEATGRVTADLLLHGRIDGARVYRPHVDLYVDADAEEPAGSGTRWVRVSGEFRRVIEFAFDVEADLDPETVSCEFGF